MFYTGFKEVITDSGPFNLPREITLTVRRLDLIDPITGGNKWFKLIYNLDHMRREGFNHIVTFGGAWSNHIAAVARAGRLDGFSTTGIIRGEPSSVDNTTLARAKADGMHLVFISRNDYRKKEEPGFLSSVLKNSNRYYVIPEGGSNTEGAKGCMKIIDDTDSHYTHIAVACGTGTTATGIISKLNLRQQLIGFSVLNDKNSIETNILSMLDKLNPDKLYSDWKINHDFHFGGYAKTHPDLTNFIEQFSARTGIPVEPVYTGKMFYGLYHMIREEKIPTHSRILAIHTGGLQYLRSD